MTRRSDNGAVEKLSQFLTSQHLRQLKFVGVVTVMTLLCGIFLWYLFAPKPAPQQAGAGGYNVTIPEATVKPAETDKRKVYEQEQYEQQRREKLQSLGPFMRRKKCSGRPKLIISSPESYSVIGHWEPFI